MALVQGPPGSGKTTTIVGMISALLASSGRGGSSSVGTKAQLEGPCTAAPGGKPASAGSSLAAPAAVPPTTDRRTQDGSNGGNDASTSVRAKGAASTTPSTSATAAAAAAEPARPASASSRPAVRVLMCAQSNAAVDELVHRLVTDGVWTAGGGRRRPTVVRVGRLDATHEAVKRYHIDVLEQQKAPQGGGSAAAVGSSGGGGAAAAAKAAAEAGRLRERLAELAGRVRLLEAEQQTLEALLTSGSNAGGGGGGGNSNDGAPTTNGSGSSSGIKRRKLANGRAAAAAAEGSSSASAADHQQQLASVREEVTGLREQQQELSRLLAEADAKSKATSATANSRAAEAAGRRELRAAVLASAEVVACTLSVAGSELIAASAGGGAAAAAPASAAAAVAAPSVGGGGSAFSKGVISAIATAAGSSSSSSSSHKFDALIIDEAAQAVEPAALVPLHLVKPGARVILVGDAKQLPPTLLSRLAGAAAAFCNSLFERLQRGGCRAVMLTEQYRMHPAISRFPASFFYGSDLVDGQGVCGDSRSLPCHALPPFGPLAVFDVADGRERRGGGSGGAGGYMSNREEAELAAALLQQALEQRGCGGGRLGSVAVLTPYRAQRSQLAASFRSAVRDEAVLKRVEFATVDAFQVCVKGPVRTTRGCVQLAGSLFPHSRFRDGGRGRRWFWYKSIKLEFSSHLPCPKPAHHHCINLSPNACCCVRENQTGPRGGRRHLLRRQGPAAGGGRRRRGAGLPDGRAPHERGSHPREAGAVDRLPRRHPAGESGLSSLALG